MKCGCAKDGVTGLAHIGIIVKDTQRSVGFYTEALGFECYFSAEVPGGSGATKLTFLRRGTCVIELIEPPQATERQTGPVDHIALLVSSMEAVMERLSKRGVTFETERPKELPMLFDNGVKSIFFRGPDGERIELSEEL